MELPSRPSLPQLRRQARELHKSLQAAEPPAIALLVRYHPCHRQVLAADQPRLADAQLILARQYGFASWPRFKAHVELAVMGVQQRAARFVKLATVTASGSNDNAYQQACALLETDAGLADASLHTALVLGDHQRLSRALARTPDLAHTPAGPRHWQPLLYVCFSKLHRRHVQHRDGLLTCARLLLEAGANPNVAFTVEPWPDSPLRPLYGACGVTNFPAMAALLLDHGADPDDNESLYHAVEQPDTDCLSLLLRRGASAHGSNALNRSLDQPGLSRIQLLLDHGADPNEIFQDHGTSLHMAIQKGREVAVLALLVAHGADIEARRRDSRSPYQVALQHGHQTAVAYLAGLGADTTASLMDRFLAACGAGDSAGASRLREAQPDILAALSSCDAQVVFNLAEQGKAGALAMLLEQGLPMDLLGLDGETLLHVAAWHGHARVVQTLLARGAPLEVVERQFGCTPLGWAAHGCDNWPNPDGDYPAVVTALLAAGADIQVSNHWGESLLDLAGSNQVVADLLRGHGARDRDD